MISYEEFEKNCSYSIESRGDQASVLVIFSKGFMQEYGKDFVKKNTEVAKKLVTHTLYDFLKETFKDG